MPHPDLPLSRALLLSATLATLLAGAIAALGMLASFHTVSTEMQPGFGPTWAWTVPATLDLTVAAFSLLEIVLLRLRLPHLLARITVYAATTATIYLNTRPATAHDHAQLLAHAAMPTVWVLYIELLRTAAAALTRREHTNLEHPALALVLAPAATITAWRRRILTPCALSQHHDTPAGQTSTASGHFPACDLHGDTTHRSTDIFRDTTPDTTGAPPHTPANDTPQTTAETPSPTPQHQPIPTPLPIGKGRGLSSRHAVTDLAHRHPEMTNQQIATRLNLSTRTVRRHLNKRQPHDTDQPPSPRPPPAPSFAPGRHFRGHDRREHRRTAARKPTAQNMDPHISRFPGRDGRPRRTAHHPGPGPQRPRTAPHRPATKYPATAATPRRVGPPAVRRATTGRNKTPTTAHISADA
jgi:hypothetical protein